jgi:signal transduction histidine kinase
MPLTSSSDLTGLPKDAGSILNLAAKSLFDVIAHASEGMLLVDHSGSVVWINDQYRRFLPALGYASKQEVVEMPVSALVDSPFPRLPQAHFRAGT